MGNAVPAQPAAPTATALSSSSAVVNFTPLTSSTPPVTGYTVSVVGQPSLGCSAPVVTGNPAPTQCSVNSLTPGQTRGRLYDRGVEMACHPELARRLKIDIWFCDPHAPWQRGSNENTNGLLRQFLPKGTDLRKFSQRDLDHIARLMNNRPRKTLGWKTPAQALAEEIAMAAASVAVGT